MLNNLLALHGGGTAPDYGSYVPIQSYTVGAGGQSSIDFTSIPSTYTHLQVRYIVRSTQAATETGINARINSDSGSNYAYHYIFGDGASVVAGAGATQTSINLINVTGASATSNTFAAGVFDLLDYTSTSKNKTIRLLQGWDGNGSGRLNFSSGLRMNSSTAVSSISF